MISSTLHMLVVIVPPHIRIMCRVGLARNSEDTLPALLMVHRAHKEWLHGMMTFSTNQVCKHSQLAHQKEARTLRAFLTF